MGNTLTPVPPGLILFVTPESSIDRLAAEAEKGNWLPRQLPRHGILAQKRRNFSLVSQSLENIIETHFSFDQCQFDLTSTRPRAPLDFTSRMERGFCRS